MQDNHIDVIPEKTKLSSGFDVSLPMHPELRQHLIELAGDRKNLSGYILPEIAERHQRDSSTLVCEIQDFLRQSGIKVHKDGTGVDGIRAVPQYGFHSCRHTFVSICSKRKVPDSVIKSIVGDSYALYTHVDMESKREAISKIPSYSTLQNEDEIDTQTVVSKMTNTELEDILRSVVLELERRKIESAA